MTLLKQLTKELQDCTNDYVQVKQERDIANTRVQSLLEQLAMEPDKQMLDILRLENADFRKRIDALKELVRDYWLDDDMSGECSCDFCERARQLLGIGEEPTSNV